MASCAAPENENHWHAMTGSLSPCPLPQAGEGGLRRLRRVLTLNPKKCRAEKLYRGLQTVAPD